MQELFRLKPNKTAFVTYAFAKGAIPLLVALGVISAIVNLGAPILIPFFAVAYLVLMAWSYFSLSVRYKKENYIFYPEKIIAKSGGVFHDKETELVIRNITHVTLKRPWLENKFFGTGRVIIELAGSAVAEAKLNSVDHPMEAYNHIEKMMKENGFRLGKQKLVQKERPSVLAAAFETVKIFFGTLVVLLFASAWSFEMLSAIANIFGIGAILGIAALAVLGVLLFSLVRFLDLMKRVYFIYNDTIIYKEGFLTKVDSFIPIENLADSELTQTLVDKIFGLFDVRVSCQGVGHEILFKNLRNGPLMEKNIDGLINQTTSLVGKGRKQVSEEVKGSKLAPGKTLPLTVEKNFTAAYKMEMGRTVAMALLIAAAIFVAGIIIAFFSLPVGISIAGLGIFFLLPGLIGSAIKVSCTNYAIKPQGMQETFNFLNRRDVEFSNDKITGVVFSRNFIDEWFNTISIKFWSIGAAHDINFANVKAKQGIRENMLAKFGITGKETPVYQAESKFSFGEMLKANIAGLIIAALVFAGLALASLASPIFLVPAVLLAIIIIAAIIYRGYYYRTSKIYFFKNFVHFRAGIFFKHYYYSLYDNVKDITTVRYPFSSMGLVRFNVAGEGMQGQQQKQNVWGKKNQAGMLVPHQFIMNYVPRLREKDELIDLMFYKRLSAQQVKSLEANIEKAMGKGILDAKPSLENSLLWTIVALGFLTIFIGAISIANPIILLFIAVFDIAVLAFVIMSIRAMSYSIQSYRIIAKKGIWFKTQTSIIFTKIDHLRAFQGITHKLFSNGTIIVHTTGSSRPEITIRDVPNHREFYSTLEKYY